MTGDFIDPLPQWASWAIALALCLGSALAFRRIKSLRSRLSYGVGSTVAVFVGIAIVFVVARVYVQLFVPLLSVFTTFLIITILRFVFSEQEKSFLR